MSNLIGQSLGRYHILEQLGEGGMATVYKAYDTRLERDVAVKVIRVDQFAPAVLERILKRFEREAKALARLTHPNIVHVNDFGEQDGIPFLVMDYLSGGTLKQRLGKPMPWQEAVKLLLPVAEALDYAHSQGIIHRDVKPSNILLTQRGQPMLTDFGIAKLLESEDTQTLTGTGAGVGTPEYMAPEQVNARTVDQRADIYALGVVLYELITGRKPFQADTPMAVMIMQARDPLPRPRQFVPDLPEAVEKLLIKALAKKPEDRYQSMGEMAAALEVLLVGQAVPVKSVVSPRPAALPAQRMGHPMQEKGEAAAVQEATQDIIPPVYSTSAGPVAFPSYSIPTKKRPWWPWATGMAGLLLVACIAVAVLVVPKLFATSAPATTTPATAAPATTTPATAAPATAVPSTATEVPLVPGAPLPRNETLYFNGQQWGSVVCWNPYSSNCNNEMAIAQLDNARVTMFETPYLYDMLDGKSYPLLADGPWAWNAAGTDITFKIKAAAHWSDGTPVTAGDVAYTWATHLRYNDNVGAADKTYIDTITAVDAHTVDVKAKLDASGKPVNPLIVAEYLDAIYVLQKAWTQKLEARTGGDATKLMADTAMDVVYSGPYHFFFADDSKVVMIRDDNYWGQDSSMWGKLPAPKYLAHIIYANENAGLDAFKAGEVDVSQQYIANVQDLWLVDNLPVSTYIPNAPYGIGASLLTAFYNLKSYGLDQVAVRKAIAMAVDYPTIIANAMTNQSATFDQVPRSLMNPTPGEQALYDHTAVADLQWAGNDIEGAKALLDAANIKDTNADGWREYHGVKLTYVATCPNGWTDWQAAIEVIAAAGRAIGIDITANYPEWSDYQVAVTNWPLPATGYDIFMMWSDDAGPTEPWGRVNHLLNSKYAETTGNLSGNWGGYANPDADALIKEIPTLTDPAKIKDDYTQLVKIYLTDVPSFTLFYRPQSFHTVNESVWTNFPHDSDGTNPPVPPLDMTDGWAIADLYNLRLVK